MTDRESRRRDDERRSQGRPSSSGRRTDRGEVGSLTMPRPSHRSLPSARKAKSTEGASSNSRSRSFKSQRSTEPLLPVNKTGSVRSGASSTASVRARRDMSLAAYVEKLKVTGSKCDEALKRLTNNYQTTPEQLTLLQAKVEKVMKLITDIKGTVSDEMFRELRQTEKNIEAYNAEPISLLSGMLSGWWWTADEEDSPVRRKLVQLVDTCESLMMIEEILTSQLHVLNWDVFEAIKPPVDQEFCDPKGVKVTLSASPDGGNQKENTTCCFCCSTEPVPIEEPRGNKNTRPRSKTPEEKIAESTSSRKK